MALAATATQPALVAGALVLMPICPDHHRPDAELSTT
jgi:hypothetical protein